MTETPRPSNPLLDKIVARAASPAPAPTAPPAKAAPAHARAPRATQPGARARVAEPAPALVRLANVTVTREQRKALKAAVHASDDQVTVAAILRSLIDLWRSDHALAERVETEARADTARARQRPGRSIERT
jgi:hypothetical protein